MKQQSTFGPLVRSRWLLLWATACSAEVDLSQKVTFGPDDCVSLSRSAAGTCVLATDCEGKDTSAVEFSFLCADATGMEVKHTFGTGGFLDKETYDTEVACDRCLRDGSEAESTAAAKAAEEAPAKAAAAAEAEDSDRVASTADSRALLTKFAKSKPEEPAGVPPSTSSFYGPGGCVAVYKDDKAGTCWMQTRCQGQNISDYDFGMNCADADGQITKHMFGKNSFDAEETFNTLVTCDTCLALDQEPAKGVSDLAITVLSLEKELDSIKADVKTIHDEMGIKSDEGEKKAEDGETKAEDGETKAEDGETKAEDGGEGTATEDEVAATADEATTTEDDAAAAAAEEASAADEAAEAAATDAVEDGGDEDADAVFLRKSRKSMRKVRHHGPHHHAAPKKVHHRAHAAIKKHVHHKRVVDDDLDLDQPDMAEY